MASPLYKKFMNRFVHEHTDEYNTCMRLAEKAKQEGKEKQEKHWLNEAEEARTKANYYQTILREQQEEN